MTDYGLTTVPTLSNESGTESATWLLPWGNFESDGIWETFVIFDVDMTILSMDENVSNPTSYLWDECGDGVVQGSEECDGPDFASETCTTLGYGDGLLKCDTDCTIDTSPCGSSTACSDDDGDGWTDCDGDCSDTNASIHPEAPDVCRDGIDQDCSGSDRMYGPGCKIKERRCADGVDNDADGSADCADVDCAGKAGC